MDIPKYIREQLDLYDKSSPKMDELKFVQNIMDTCNLPRKEVLRLIRIERRKK